MRPKGTTVAVDTAVAHLKAGLAEGEWRSAGVLPTVRSLASAAGVSPGTMTRALEVLKSEGAVTGDRRRRYRPASGTTVDPSPEPLPRWIAKKLAFERDIVTGRFGVPAGVPSLKELQSRYGVCFQTMRKILRALVTEGVLISDGKRYSLSDVPRRSRRQRITMIVHKDFFADDSALSHGDNRIANMYENECIHTGLQLEIVQVDFYSTMTGCASYRPVDSNDIEGYILEAWQNELESLQRPYEDLLARLCSHGKPVALFDHAGDFVLPVQFRANPIVQVFRIEGRRAGERMARYLLSLGHHSAVYLSSLHYSHWSQARYEGVADQFSRAGSGDSLHLAVATTHLFLPAMLTNIGLSDDDVRTLLALKHTKSQVDDLQRRWMEFKNTHTLPFPGYPQLTRGEKEYLEELVALNRQKANPAFTQRTHAGALGNVADRFYDLSIRPLFTEAIRHRDATAWVCASDSIAFGSLSFLKKRKIDVPGQISVVGFDNAPAAILERRLTTLDFNALDFIRRMLHFVTRPPRPRGTHRHRTIEIEAFVVERDTAGRPRPSE